MKATDSMLWEALEIAQLKPVVKTLPGGLGKTKNMPDTDRSHIKAIVHQKRVHFVITQLHVVPNLLYMTLFFFCGA